MRTSTIWFCIAVSMLITLSGCKGNNIDTDLMIEETCHPPCWNSIIPGETSEDQAIEILHQLELENKGILKISESNISWYSNDGKSYVIQVNKAVVQIRFEVKATSLEKLIEQFGQPNGFIVIPGRHNGFALTLYYPQSGLAFLAQGSKSWGLSSKRAVTRDMPITYAYFVAPSDIRGMLTVIHGVEWVDKLLPELKDWTGYGEVTP